MANWTQFAARFPKYPADGGDIATAYETEYTALGYETFATTTAIDFANDLAGFSNTHGIIVALSEWLIECREELGINPLDSDAWDQFAQGGFGGALGDFITELGLAYIDASLTFANFDEDTALTLATRMAATLTMDDAWSAFGNVVVDYIEGAARVVHWTNLLETIFQGSEHQTKAIKLFTGINDLRDGGSLTELSQLPPRQIASFLHSISTVDNPSAILYHDLTETALIEASAELADGNYADNEWENVILSRMIPEEREGIKLFLTEYLEVNPTDTLRDIKDATTGTLSAILEAYPAYHLYFHGTAGWLIRLASEMVALEQAEADAANPTARHSFHAQFYNNTDAGDAPLLNPYTVEIQRETDEEDVYETLGTQATDSRGVIRVDYDYPLDTESVPVPQTFRFRIVDIELGELLLSDPLEYTPGTTNAFQRFGFEEAAPTETPSQELNASFFTTYSAVSGASSDLKAYVDGKTLKEIRADGLLQLDTHEDVQGDLEFAKKIDAFAMLELLGSNAELSNRLVEGGIRTLADFEKKGRVGVLGIENGEGEIFLSQDKLKVYLAAERASAIIKARVFDEQANHKNGHGGTAFDEPMNLGLLYGDSCDCTECRTAVSPLAYLTTLAKYVTDKIVKLEGEEEPYTEADFDLEDLVDTTRQDISYLGLDCSQLDESVCQQRIATEVLWRKLDVGDYPTTVTMRAKYLDGAYESLLAQLGVSMGDLKLAVDGISTVVTTASLAQRLGIAEEDVQHLLLEGEDLTEDALEKVFGLAATEPNRSPYANCTVEGTTGRVYNVRLNGVFWGYNTDNDGLVYLEIDGLTTSDTVKLYRASSLDEELLVAQGAPTAQGDLYRVKLVQVNDSGLSGELLLYAAADGHTINLRPVPKLLAAQLRKQFANWREEDLVETNPYLAFTQTVPYIDPDLISLSDIRRAPDWSTSNDVYDIWKTRREWVDALLDSLAAEDGITEAGALMGTQSVSYDGSTPGVVWVLGSISGSGGTFTGAMDSLAEQLASPAPATVAAAIAEIEDELYLTVEAFKRLNELRQKTAPTIAERLEANGIMASAAKKKYETAWITEEQTDVSTPGLLVSHHYFNTPKRAPTEGTWNPSANYLAQEVTPFYLTGGSAAVLIDPDYLNAADVPPGDFQEQIQTLLTTRISQLQVKYAAVLAQSETGVMAMVEEAIGEIEYDVHTTTEASLLALRLEIEEGVSGAGDHIRHTLFITEESFEVLMGIYDLEQAESTVSVSKYEKLAFTLSRAYKRQELIGNGTDTDTWKYLEENATVPIEHYWQVYPHRLVPGLATPAQRTIWEEALAASLEVPRVDPDHIGPGDFVNPESILNTQADNPAFDLYLTRNALLKAGGTWEAALTGTLATDVEAVLQITSAEETFEDVKGAFAAGEDWSWWLAQQNLTRGEFNFLAAMLELPSLTASQEASANHILIAVKRRRNFGLWRREETELGIFTSPHFFREALPGGVETEEYWNALRKPWRSNITLRRRFLNEVRLRLSIMGGMRDTLRNYVAETEDGHLIKLRDLLVSRFTLSGYTTVPQKARRLGDSLFIDLEMTCCARTTRVAQAIESLQSILFKLRNSLMGDLHANLKLKSDTFDEDWRWLGSYENWRSLMFLYLYPENLLLPQYVPNPSPAFRTLIGDVREARTFTPDMACRAVHDFDEYYQDMRSLKMGASLITNVNVRRNDKECATDTTVVTEKMAFLFATAQSENGKGGRLYWCTYEPEGADRATKHTHWMPLPTNNAVNGILGTVVYKNPKGDRTLYLFYTAENPGGRDQKLVLAKLSLETLQWGSEHVDLPASKYDWLFVHNYHLLPTYDETVLPTIVCTWVQNAELTVAGDLYDLMFGLFNDKKHLQEAPVHIQRTNEDGSGWLFDDFCNVGSIRCATNIKLLGAVQTGVNELSFIAICKRTNSLNAENTIYAFPFNIPQQSNQISQRDYGHTFPGTGIGQNLYLVPKGSHTWLSVASSDGSTINNAVNGMSNAEYKQSSFVVPQQSMLYDAQDEPGHYFRLTYGEIDTNKKRHFNLFFGRWWQEDAIRHKFVLEDNLAITAPVDSIGFGVRNHVQLKLRYMGPAVPEPGYNPAVAYNPQWLIRQLSFAEGQIIRAVNHADALNPAVDSSAGGNYAHPVLILPSHISAPLDPDFTQLDQNFHRESLGLYHNELVQAKYSRRMKEVFLEGVHHLRVLLASALSRSKYFNEALEQYRYLYDFTRKRLIDDTGNLRKVSPLLNFEEDSGQGSYTQAIATLFAGDDYAYNPHVLAASRRNANTRYVVYSLIQTLLDYADAEFTRDTAESVPRARELYEQAIRLLKEEALQDIPLTCAERIDAALASCITDPLWYPEWLRFRGWLLSLNSEPLLSALLEDGVGDPAVTLHDILCGEISPWNTAPWEDRIHAAEALVSEALGLPEFEQLMGTGSTANVNHAGNLGSLMGGQTATGSLNTMLLFAQSPSVGGAVQDAAQQAGQSLDGIMCKVGLDGEIEQSGLGDYTTDTSNTALVYSDADLYSGTTLQQVAVDNYAQNAIMLLVSYGIYRPYIPELPTGFCIPANPVAQYLLLQAEVNLAKIRSCRNIAGLVRELDPYAAPTDAFSGAVGFGDQGHLTRPAQMSVPATNFRYDYLVQRAKELVQYAQQVEGALLSALEKLDNERFQQLQVRQQIDVARQSVRLQDLRIKEARTGVDMANEQVDRAELMSKELQVMIDDGINGFEDELVNNIRSQAQQRKGLIEMEMNIKAIEATVKAYQVMASTVVGTSNSINPAAAALAGIALLGQLSLLNSEASYKTNLVSLETSYQILQINVTQKRREQEWQYQQKIANQDKKIAETGVQQAEQRVDITQQERLISNLQLTHAQDTLNFLQTKFTSAELYDWMSGVLENVFGYFLSEATSIARLAEQQLAFERQEFPQTIILPDYWTTNTASLLPGGAGASETPDRKGLTGSVRLLQDIIRLERYAMDTKRRKLNLTKTVSLSSLFPADFVKFRETGILRFTLPKTLFDRDFPGHYLRIINQVRTTVVALVPPTDGIKATLWSLGTSNVEVKGITMGTAKLKRQPEQVALTSPVNATGMFIGLEQQPGEMYFPFEGLGVCDSTWEFRMGRAANRFDFSTIADVLITIDYTALEDRDYAVITASELDAQPLGATRMFSLRGNFPDQWFDLHNPDLIDPPYQVDLEIFPYDFPRDLSNFRINKAGFYVILTEEGKRAIAESSVSLSIAYEKLLFGRKGVAGVDMALEPNGYTANLGSQGTLATQMGITPAGTYTLQFEASSPNLRNAFDNDWVEDILILVEYEGQPPLYKPFEKGN